MAQQAGFQTCRVIITINNYNNQDWCTLIVSVFPELVSSFCLVPYLDVWILC